MNQYRSTEKLGLNQIYVDRSIDRSRLLSLNVCVFVGVLVVNYSLVDSRLSARAVQNKKRSSARERRIEVEEREERDRNSVR